MPSCKNPRTNKYGATSRIPGLLFTCNNAKNLRARHKKISKPKNTSKVTKLERLA